MSHTVRFAPQALAQLDTIEDYILHAGSPRTAARYVEAIVSYCESLATFPHRGMQRDDLLPGLRITNYRHSAVIAFLVDDEAKSVSIIGVFYGGQDYEAVLPDLSDG
ncbi:type II toxin-antitoxin system RelE/ParE family toxin [Alcaligenaceae bacterium]|nr:type II toxin-antitoxin system RelE/ParE family toxin [Alcaligenaceae bacterium]